MLGACVGGVARQMRSCDTRRGRSASVRCSSWVSASADTLLLLRYPHHAYFYDRTTRTRFPPFPSPAHATLSYSAPSYPVNPYYPPCVLRSPCRANAASGCSQMTQLFKEMRLYGFSDYSFASLRCSKLDYASPKSRYSCFLRLCSESLHILEAYSCLTINVRIVPPRLLLRRPDLIFALDDFGIFSLIVPSLTILVLLITCVVLCAVQPMSDVKLQDIMVCTAHRSRRSVCLWCTMAWYASLFAPEFPFFDQRLQPWVHGLRTHFRCIAVD